MIYRTISMPNGGESQSRGSATGSEGSGLLRWVVGYGLADGQFLLRGIEEKKIKYYAIDSVDVLHKLGSAGGGDPW